MRLLELTLPLDYHGMPDEVFPTATQFLLAPRGEPEKGITVGTDTGTSILLPAQFAAFRQTRRLDVVPTAALVLRPTCVVDLPTAAHSPLDAAALQVAVEAADLRDGDALLLRTGWGDGAPGERRGPAYLLDSPFLAPDGAAYLATALAARGSDLLLVDTALLGRPDAHLIPEWTTLAPRALCWPSETARGYLQGYREREVLEDWAADRCLAEAGIMTVKRLVGCGAIQARRVQVVVAPLRLVRGVGSPCRVVAVEEAPT
jgi:kynurenine formamidase